MCRVADRYRGSARACAGDRAGDLAGAGVRRRPVRTPDRGAPSFPSALAVSVFPGWRPCRRAAAAAVRDRVRRDSLWVSCRAIDEIAVEGELSNEWIDLPQREWHRWAA